MDLGSVFSRVVNFSKPEAGEEHFLAIKFSSTEVLATLWSLSSGHISIGAVGAQKISSTNFEDLLKATDTAVSQSLGDKELPAAQTIFGVSPDWIAEGKIVPEKLALIRRLCKELDLRPLGYVQPFEALENYLKETEGAPLTAILISLDAQKGWVTLIRAGKNLGTVALTESTPLGIEQALKTFTQIDVLPARMIIYDGHRDLKALEETIMAYPWTKQLPFLHFPRVEILSGESVIRAVAAASATQMGGKIEITNNEPLENMEVVPKEEKESIEETILDQGVELELAEISAEEAGFIQEGNLGKLKEIEEFNSEQPPAQPIKINLPKVNFAGILFALKSLKEKIKVPKVNFSRAPLALLLVVLSVIVGLGLMVYFLPKVNILVHLTPKPFDKEMELTISGQFMEVSELGSKKGVATGKKLVGEKAHGSVTIYSTSASKTFPAGTLLVSPNGLKVSLNNDVAVASGSGAASQVTASATVTAADIGDSFNFPAGTLFTISSFPSSAYQAKSDSALSGGNSHEATVVTKNDQDRLLATLSAELTEKAKIDLNTKIAAGQSLLPNAITSVVSKKRFSKDVDSEADTISLDITMDFKGIVVSQSELVQRFLDKYALDIAPGYELDRQTAKPEISSAKLDKSGNAVLTTKLSAITLPMFNTLDLAKNIKGKVPQTAIDIIKRNMGVASVEIEANPRWSSFVTDRFLPWRVGNISIETVSD